MKRSYAGIVVAIIVVALRAGSGAQPDSGLAGGPAQQGRAYNPSTVETVSGEVVSVQRGEGARRGGGGVHLVLRSDANATLSIRLGPAAYVDRQAMKIASGDRIEVKGSRVTIEGQPAIIAAEVRKGDQTLLLRHGDGTPYWSGGRRRTPS